MFPPSQRNPNTVYVSYQDSNALLSSCSPHAIELENLTWPSVEHYVQAMKFSNERYREKIRTSANPSEARKLGNALLQAKRKDWKRQREIYMTRGMYIKCKKYPEVAQALLDTRDHPILDTSHFDYFWGCGRDSRGENRFGAVLEAIRSKLRLELSTND